MGEQKEEIFLSQRGNGTWKNFVDLELDLEPFCTGRAKRRGSFDLELICPKVRGKKNWTNKIFVQESKREKESWT